MYCNMWFYFSCQVWPNVEATTWDGTGWSEVSQANQEQQQRLWLRFRHRHNRLVSIISYNPYPIFRFFLHLCHPFIPSLAVMWQNYHKHMPNSDLKIFNAGLFHWNQLQLLFGDSVGFEAPILQAECCPFMLAHQTAATMIQVITR